METESEGIARNSWEFHLIPEFRESLPIPESDGIAGIASNSGIGRNSREFRAIPCNSLSTQFPEFRTGIASLSQRLIFDHNSMREGEGGK